MSKKLGGQRGQGQAGSAKGAKREGNASHGAAAYAAKERVGKWQATRQHGLFLAAASAPQRGGDRLASHSFSRRPRGRDARAGLRGSAASMKLVCRTLLYLMLLVKKPFRTSVAVGEVLDHACPHFANTVITGKSC